MNEYMIIDETSREEFCKQLQKCKNLILGSMSTYILDGNVHYCILTFQMNVSKLGITGSSSNINSL